MLDDLRKGGFEDDEFDPSAESDDFSFHQDDEDVSKRFLGMTAVERMFLSIFLFMNVVVLGMAFLVVTGRFAL